MNDIDELHEILSDLEDAPKLRQVLAKMLTVVNDEVRRSVAVNYVGHIIDTLRHQLEYHDFYKTVVSTLQNYLKYGFEIETVIGMRDQLFDIRNSLQVSSLPTKGVEREVAWILMSLIVFLYYDELVQAGELFNIPPRLAANDIADLSSRVIGETEKIVSLKPQLSEAELTKEIDLVRSSFNLSSSMLETAWQIDHLLSTVRGR